MSYYNTPRGGSSSSGVKGWWVVGSVIGAIFLLWLFILVIGLISSRATPQAGQVGVVRSGPSITWVGSWFNGHNIRKVIPPGSGSSFIGLGSETHFYPSDSVQRTYTITSDPQRGDRPAVDVVEVPTSDGVRVGLEGAFYFTTAFNGGTKPQTVNGQQLPSGVDLTKDFDNRFGVRTFPVIGQHGAELHPWEGTDGWSAYLDTAIRPIIDNDLRRSIANVTCTQLVSSCALVHNQGQGAQIKQGLNTTEIQRVQDAINSGLKADIKNTLGVDYFSNIQFLLSKVVLPTPVQDQIDNAQAQFASVGAANAEVQRNHALAQAKAELQKAYQNCPACATIDELKAIPPNVTTFAPGSGFAITQPGK